MERCGQGGGPGLRARGGFLHRPLGTEHLPQLPGDADGARQQLHRHPLQVLPYREYLHSAEFNLNLQHLDLRNYLATVTARINSFTGIHDKCSVLGESQTDVS